MKRSAAKCCARQVVGKERRDGGDRAKTGLVRRTLQREFGLRDLVRVPVRHRPGQRIGPQAQ